MHFSYVEIGDNFVPDYATDPYRRVPVKFGITLNPGESLEEAKEAIKQAIKEYIHENKIESPHIVERYIPEEQLPTYQVREPLSMMPEDNDIEKAIWSCNEIKVLESYRLLAKCEQRFQSAYDIRMEQLQHIDN
jgi:hypothetical protein